MKHVVVAVGANDFDFSGVVAACIKIYETLHILGGGRFCYNSGTIQSAITPEKRSEIENDIFKSLSELAKKMTMAGYTKDQYSVVLQNYWSAIPSDKDIRIPDDDLQRQWEGGCPILNPDATALNEYLLPAINGTVLNAAKRFRAEAHHPRIRFMDVSEALKGHRLCEKGVGLIEDIPNFSGKGTRPRSGRQGRMGHRGPRGATQPLHTGRGWTRELLGSAGAAQLPA